MNKENIFVTLCIIVVVTSLTLFSIGDINPASKVKFVPGDTSLYNSNPELYAIINDQGIEFSRESELLAGDQLPETYTSDITAQDNFMVTDWSEEELAAQTLPETSAYDVSTAMPYKHFGIDFPLKPRDYYWGKWLNAKAGAGEINKIPELVPGNRINLIRNGYLTLSPAAGYVRPTNGYYYGSGLCWSTSVLGGFMDAANWHFTRTWGIPLFTFNTYDRAPHPSYYETYKNSNNGYGYTVIKIGSGGRDYSFNINPEVGKIRALGGLKIKIVLNWTNKFPGASHGESIGAYLLSNKNLQPPYIITDSPAESPQ